MVKQEMEIDHTSVRIPPGVQILHLFIVRYLFQTEPVLDLVSCSYIIPGENVKPPETSQQSVLGGPSPDAPQLLQEGDCFIIIHNFRLLKIQAAGNPSGNLNQGSPFLAAKAK